tara:strand:+ start:453 stop:602 length:150 start_codon:yes stop_codon:yes gene_type:complete
MMNWTKVHLKSMDITQLRELKKYVDEILKRKIEQSKRLPDEDLVERHRP